MYVQYKLESNLRSCEQNLDVMGSENSQTPMHHSSIATDHEGSTISVMKIAPSPFHIQGAGFGGSSGARGSFGIGWEPTGTTIGA